MAEGIGVKNSERPGKCQGYRREGGELFGKLEHRQHGEYNDDGIHHGDFRQRGKRLEGTGRGTGGKIKREERAGAHRGKEKGGEDLTAGNKAQFTETLI